MVIIPTTCSFEQHRRPALRLRGGSVHKEIHDSPSPIAGFTRDVHNLFLTPHGDCGDASTGKEVSTAQRLTTKGAFLSYRKMVVGCPAVPF